MSTQSPTNTPFNVSKPKTHLKASVTILTAVILASCSSDGSDSQSYTLGEIFNNTPIVTPTPDANTPTPTPTPTPESTPTPDANTPTPEPTPTPDTNTPTPEPTPTPDANTPTPDKNTSLPAETRLSGAQHLSIDASGLGKGKLTATIREFDIRSKSDIDARADKAAEGLLEVPVAVEVSSASDSETEKGYKSYTGEATVNAGPLGEKPLSYISVYKDFGEEMRTGHIDGTVDTGVIGLLPVDGVYVIGNATQASDVPTEGTAQYSGDATYRKVGDNQSIEYGSSVFTADFVAKSLAGDLTFAKAGNIGLAATIDGNEFSGSKDGYTTEGGFYGSGAAFLGGIYEGNDAQGTFGAKKK